jgi:TPR repeat protein
MRPLDLTAIAGLLLAACTPEHKAESNYFPYISVVFNYCGLNNYPYISNQLIVTFSKTPNASATTESPLLSCKEWNAHDCLQLGIRYVDGQGVMEDLGLAAQLFRRACDGSSARGCTELGQLYKYGDGVTQDYARAAQLFHEACKNGHPRGCADLGLLYAQGDGVPADTIRAAQFFKQACWGGDAQGCYYYGGLNLQIVE